MTPFLSIPLPAKSLLMVMLLAAAVFSFFCFFMVADTDGRKSRKAALLVISAVSVILLTFIADAHNSYMSGDSLSDTDAVCMGIPAVFMVIYILVISAYMAFVLYKESVICRDMITRSSIRESADMMPIGLCFARPGGHPYLVNRRMEELSHAVLGRSLQNEESFWSDVSAGGIEPDTRRITIDGISAIMLGNGSVWAFDRKIINVSGTDVVQLTASDMTELYQLAQRLREENHVLQKMNDRLRNYGETVEELTRTRERLAAKIRIHDSIGQNLMSTRYFLMKGADEDDACDIFVKWKRIAALLRQEDSGEECTGVIKYLTNAAESAGVRIILEGEMPEKPETQELIVAAGAEALTNAVRHAGVRELRMIIKENRDSYLIDFLNDCGDAANSSPMTVLEGGGLSSLRHRVESAGGIMSVKRGDVFTLSIILPKERNGDQ